MQRPRGRKAPRMRRFKGYPFSLFLLDPARPRRRVAGGERFGDGFVDAVVVIQSAARGI